MEVIGEVEVRIIEGNCVDRHNAWREVKTGKRSRRCLGGKRFSSLPLLYMISPWHQPHSLVNILVSKVADKNAKSAPENKVFNIHLSFTQLKFLILYGYLCGYTGIIGYLFTKQHRPVKCTMSMLYIHTHTCALFTRVPFLNSCLWKEFLQCFFFFFLNLHCSL